MAAQSGTDLRDGLSTVTRGTIFVIVSTLCLVLFNFLSRVLVVRSVSPADWSAFSLGLALSGLLAAVGTIGLPNAVARSLPYVATDEERRTIVRSGLLLSAAAAVAFGAGLAVLAQPIADALGTPSLGVGLLFFSVAIATTIVGTQIAAIFQGFADVAANALFIQIVNPGLFLAFLGVALALPHTGVTYASALASYALASAVTLAGLIVYALRRLPQRLTPGPLAPAATGRLVRLAVPLFVAGSMVSLAGFGDTLVLGVYHHTEVGTYTASLTLARLLQIGINAASYIFLPVAARFLRRGNTRAIGLTYGTVTKWMALLSTPLFLLFVLLPSRSLGFVYGANYTSVVLPLQLTVAGAFAATLFGPAASAQIALGHAELLAYNSVAAGIADVGIAIALVPSYGYVGAAAAWGCSTVLYAGLCLAELAALNGFHPFQRHFLVPLVATAVPMAALLYVVRHAIPEWALPPVGLVVAGCFAVVVLVTRSIDEGDRLLLGAVEGMVGRPLPFVHRLRRWYGRRVSGP